MEQQKQDWIGFFTDFVKLVQKLGREYGAAELSRKEVHDKVSEYFIEAHAFGDHSQLHEKMVSVWTQMQEAMDEIEDRRAGNEASKEFSQFIAYERFKKNMIRLFNDPTQVWNTKIPIETRVWYEYSWTLSSYHH